jgi:hypothetical protein
MAMKYRQQGYQDSDRDREKDRERRKPQRKGPLSPEERARMRGLRHATDREANEVVRCPTCGRNIQSIGVITRETFCPHCNSAIHCCRACVHFDSGARMQCRAEIDQPVSDKMTANSCPKYEARLVLDATGRRSGSAQGGDPKSAFENLFKR